MDPKKASFVAVMEEGGFKMVTKGSRKQRRRRGCNKPPIDDARRRNRISQDNAASSINVSSFSDFPRKRKKERKNRPEFGALERSLGQSEKDIQVRRNRLVKSLQKTGQLLKQDRYFSKQVVPLLRKTFLSISGKEKETKEEVEDSLALPSLLPHIQLRYVICAGLGSLLNSPPAQYQFALLQELIPLLPSSIEKLFIFEPNLSKEACDVIMDSRWWPKGFHVEAIAMNFSPDCHAPQLKENHGCIFYLPHCPVGLHDRLLARFDSDLFPKTSPTHISEKLSDPSHQFSRWVILGNSFEQYDLRLMNEEDAAQAQHILSAIHYSTEFGLSSYAREPRAFNDLAVIHFPLDKRKL